MKLTKEEALKKIEELQKYIQGEESFPKNGNRYFYVDSDGDVFGDTWLEAPEDKGRFNQNNVFKTEKEAEKYALRLESMKMTWLPEVRDDFWTINVSNKITEIHEYSWTGNFHDVNRYLTGQVFKTEEEAQDWLKKYGKAWEI